MICASVLDIDSRWNAIAKFPYETMRLEEFPGELLALVEDIAQCQSELLNAEQAVRAWEMGYLKLVNGIDLSIAFDPDLKNEQQRKAMRNEQLQQPHLAASLDTLHHLQDEVTRKRIALERLQNQFKVAMLTLPALK